jgi:hypothetical protein
MQTDSVGGRGRSPVGEIRCGTLGLPFKNGFPPAVPSGQGRLLQQQHRRPVPGQVLRLRVQPGGPVTACSPRGEPGLARDPRLLLARVLGRDSRVRRRRAGPLYR